MSYYFEFLIPEISLNDEVLCFAIYLEFWSRFSGCDIWNL